METIRTENGVSVKKEHKNISKFIVFMPKTGAIASNQTHGFYANVESSFFRDAQLSKFVRVETIQNEFLMLNTAHIIAIELGNVIELTDGKCYFISKDQDYEVIDQGNYGTTQAHFQI